MHSHDSAASPRSRRKLQISLGSIFVITAACAMGSWFWWQRPFKIERTGLHSFGEEYLQQAADPPQFRRSQQISTRWTESMRRGWGSERIRHGATIYFDQGGAKIGEEQWAEGMRHGPFRRWFTAGHLRIEGAYESGAKQGVWVIHDQQHDAATRQVAHVKRIESWHGGIPEGRWEWFDHTGKSIRHIDFHEGVPTGSLGEQIEPRLATRMRRGDIDGDLLNAWLKPVSLAMDGVPLKEAVLILQQAAEVGIGIDPKPVILVSLNRPRAEPAREMFAVSLGDAGRLLIPVDASLPEYQIEFQTPEMSKYVPAANRACNLATVPIDCETTGEVPLIVALTMMLRPHELVCDYRFGQLWITTPAAAANWRDNTGVADIKPVRGSAWESRWEGTGEADFVQLPLRDVLRFYEEAYQIPINVERVPTRLLNAPLTCNLSGHSVKDIYGYTLDCFDCRCRLEGETLVIEPQR